MAIDEPTGRQLRALVATADAAADGAPWVTLTLDGSAGSAVALTALRSMIPEAFGPVAWDTDPALAALLEAAERSLETALAAGDHGVLLVTAGDEVVLETHTPFPFRFTAHRGARPWLFEYERLHALTHRPVVVAQLHREEIDVLRIQHQDTTAAARETAELGREPSRTGQDGRTHGGQGYAGGHSHQRIQRTVEAHRARLAGAGAERIAELAGPDGLVILAGTPDALGLMHRALPPLLAERVVHEHGIDPAAPEEARVVEACRAAAQAHVAAADRLAAELLDGAHGAAGLRGPEAVARAAREGRLGTLIVHEDAVWHFGAAHDARIHAPPADERTVEQLLDAALAQDAELRIARLPALLADHAGVAGLARW